MESIIDEDLFILRLIAVNRRQTGKVKLTAKNVAGEATTEANLSFAGNPPTFLEIPYISQVLQGTTILLDIFTCENLDLWQMYKVVHKVSRFILSYYYKKLSYRRETARQLPTWRGLGPPAHSPTPPLATPMRMVEFESHNVRTSSVPSTKRTLR